MYNPEYTKEYEHIRESMTEEITDKTVKAEALRYLSLCELQGIDPIIAIKKLMEATK